MSDRKITNGVDSFVNGMIGRLEESDLDERVRVRYEYFRDVFYVNLLSNTVSKDNKAIFARKWIDIAGGGYKYVDLVNQDGEVVIVVPPIFDIGLKIEGIDKLASNYNAAKLQDKNFDTGNAKRTLENVKVNSGGEEYYNTWQELINFVENRLKLNDDVVKEEDVGYEL